MLTKAHFLADFDFAGGRLVPDRLTRVAHARYVEYAEAMLRTYRNGVGQTRQDLHRAITNLLAAEEDCPARRVAAFCKLLDDAGDYGQDREGRAAALRQRVFRMAAPSHPLVHQPDRLFERSERDVKEAIARELGRTWTEIDADLFSDIIDFNRLERFDGYEDGPALLARYNVAQVQAALYGAVSLNVWAGTDFKTILRYAKLAKLLHTISRVGEGQYLIRLDGPASVLSETRRYGAQMATFLPALIACRDWRMLAVVPVGKSGWRLRLELSSADGLRSHLPPPDDFDSELEEIFTRRWGDEPREGWRLVREGDILYDAQKAFVPDFTFVHEDGRRVLLEVVGFWTPEYLQAKADTLRHFADSKILLAVAAKHADRLPKLPLEPIYFKTRLRVEDVVQRLAS